MASSLSIDLVKPKALFFDWDGTLVDTYGVLEAAHNYALQSFNLQTLKEGGFKQYFGQPRDKVYKALYGEDLAIEAVSRFEFYFKQHHCNLISLMPGVSSLWDPIDLLNIPCGVISNKKPCLIKTEIEHLGWQDRFVSIIGSGDAKNDKPAPDPLFLGIERSGLDIMPHDIWYVGDSLVDLQAAKAAGVSCIYICHEKDKNNMIERYNPLFTFEDCFKFSTFLSKLGQN